MKLTHVMREDQDPRDCASEVSGRRSGFHFWCLDPLSLSSLFSFDVHFDEKPAGWPVAQLVGRPICLTSTDFEINGSDRREMDPEPMGFGLRIANRVGTVYTRRQCGLLTWVPQIKLHSTRGL